MQCTIMATKENWHLWNLNVTLRTVMESWKCCENDNSGKNSFVAMVFNLLTDFLNDGHKNYAKFWGTLKKIFASAT